MSSARSRSGQGPPPPGAVGAVGVELFSPRRGFRVAEILTLSTPAQSSSPRRGGALGGGGPPRSEPQIRLEEARSCHAIL